MGASSARLLSLLTRNSAVVILLATVFGGALGWFLSNGWLNNFAYRCRFGFDVIAISAALALLMYTLMVGFKLFNSITTNPAESLRTE